MSGIAEQATPSPRVDSRYINLNAGLHLSGAAHIELSRTYVSGIEGRVRAAENQAREQVEAAL